MKFELELTETAQNDINRHIKSGDKKILKKLDSLFTELRNHPETGTGKPEILKHYDVKTYSRRVSDKHRLIYRILEDKVIVLILSTWGHYADK